MIRLATVFSGVGAIEHALQRLNIDHKLVFACDNGGVNIFGKDIDDTFSEIRNELDYLKDHIENLFIPGFESYIEKLKNDLNLLTLSFNELENNIKNKNLNLKTITNKLDIVLNILDENNINIF
ncbi:MAG: DNA cytosine methyltransferase, partial [Cetobacterium sp.]